MSGKIEQRMSLDEEWEQSGLIGKIAGGRYLIVSELATDSRRTLYEAENVELGVRVTLGVVRADGTPTEQRLQNGKKLRSLQQPGLASVLDVGKLDSGDLYVATERPEGTTLRALAGGKPLEPRGALLIIRQVLEALAAAHAVGAIHGDVKPESIIITPGLGDKRVKLTDFGVATLTGATRAGDPRYSAPESALGSLDARADIYSAGAVLFELLTGHPPFFADDPNELRRLHAYAPRQPLRQRVPDLVCADLLEAVVATALEKKRDERYQSGSDMIAALDPVIEAIEAAAAASASATGERRRKPNDSLLLLAKDLMPSQASESPADAPLVPVNIARQVPELPWPTRAYRTARRGFERVRAIAARVFEVTGLRARWEALAPKQRKALAAGAAALTVILLVALVTCGGSSGKPSADAKAPVKQPTASDDTGFETEVDRVASWIVELEQATTCDERRAAIGKLAGAPDARSLPALRKAKAHKCVVRDANAAIQRITKSESARPRARD